MKSVILITGASSGFGALAARVLAKAGHTVYASMRETAGRNAPQVEAAKQFSVDNHVDLRTIELDVASQQSADEAIRTIVQRDGRLDVVIHNAGHMVFGAAEAFTPAARRSSASVVCRAGTSTRPSQSRAIPSLRAAARKTGTRCRREPPTGCDRRRACQSRSQAVYWRQSAGRIPSPAETTRR